MSSFAFLSDTAFMRLARADARQPFAIAGVAWDGCVTNRPGARFGPRAIREASHMLCDGIHPYFDTSPEGHCTDLGDLPLPNTNLEGMRAAMLPLVAPLLDRHHMAWLGGDHSITLALLRAYKAALRPAAGGDPLRCALRYLGEPLRRAQRPRHVGLRGDPRGAGGERSLRAARHPVGRRARSARLRARPGRPDLRCPRAARPGEPEPGASCAAAGAKSAWRRWAIRRCT